MIYLIFVTLSTLSYSYTNISKIALKDHLGVIYLINITSTAVWDCVQGYDMSCMSTEPVVSMYAAIISPEKMATNMCLIKVMYYNQFGFVYF